MKGYIVNVAIVLLVVANIFIGVLNINVRRPKCICDDCNRVRVTGTHYCHKHADLLDERKICLEVINRSSN